jgi:phosphoglycerol transferase MdoB-like AlkP superfamily enzyme
MLSLIAAFVFVFIIDIDLFITLYDMYFKDTEIASFFAEQGQNIFTDDVRVTTFKYIISRLIYSIIPIAICFFILVFYHSKKLPDKLLESKVFDENPSLSKIIFIGRYLLGGGLFFLAITYHRTFFSSVFHNCLMGNKPDFVRIYIASFVLLLPVVRWIDLIKDIKTFPQRHIILNSLFFIFFISIVSCCLVEFQINSKIVGILDYLIHVNVIYWIIIQIFFLAIFRNVKPGAVISLLFSYVIGLTNDIVYQFRGNYIMFGDITVVRTALEVAGNYDYKPGKWFWISLAIFLVSLVWVILIKVPKGAFYSADKAKRLISTVVVEVVIVILVIFSFKTGDFYGKVFGVGWDYNENVSVVGYLPYFFSNMDSTTRIVVPDYSVSKVNDILDFFSSDKESIKESNIEPNIILIQNEAFSDLSITTDIETDVDPMPFIHSMRENTQKGYLNMSVTGGPTSNTEFEILSRASLQYFPYGSVPYTQYLKQNIPSLVECLKNQDKPYHTVAYHSYYSSGYNRNSVYSFLGFDDKLFENNFLDDYSSDELPRGYLSDEANYRTVIKEYEKCASTNTPFFCFNVTIQGHGGYTGGPFKWSEPVKVTNFNATDSMNTYLSSIRESDNAFKGIVEYFSNVKEPTIIMMYGDHQPGWDDESKEILAEHPAWEDGMLQTLSQFYVPYVVWANFDIEEYDHLLGWKEKACNMDASLLNKLSTNYVGSYLLNAAGVELSEYDRFLLDLHEDIPAITAIGVWDKDGYYYSTAKDSPYSEKLNEQELVQYNLIFDKVNKLNESFLPQ